MSKRRQDSEIVWITPNSGFGAGGRYAVILPESTYPVSEHAAVTDPTPCMLDCDDPDCTEWTDLFTLPADSRAEAIRNLISARYSGAAYHVSECEMLDRAPEGWDGGHQTDSNVQQRRRRPHARIPAVPMTSSNHPNGSQ